MWAYAKRGTQVTLLLSKVSFKYTTWNQQELVQRWGHWGTTSATGSHPPPQQHRGARWNEKSLPDCTLLEALVTSRICPFCKQKIFFNHATASCTFTRTKPQHWSKSTPAAPKGDAAKALCTSPGSQPATAPHAREQGQFEKHQMLTLNGTGASLPLSLHHLS